MDTQLIIDRATFNDLKEVMGADFVVELIDTYTFETEGLIAQIYSALAAGDSTTFGRLAHSIKSSSASMGALKFSQQARELEMLGKAGDLAGAGPLLGRFSADFLVVKRCLEDLKNES